VAAEAGTEYCCMINPDNRLPQAGIVTILAGVRGLDVRAVLAGCRGTVMTGRAIAADTAVIERYRGP